MLETRTAEVGLRDLRNIHHALCEIVSTYNQVLSAMERQRAALVSRDAPSLESVAAEIEALISYAHEVDKSRDEHTSALARNLSIAEGEATLTEIVELAARLGQVDLSASLRETQANLTGVLTRVRDIHEGNAAMVNRQMVYTRFMLGMLSGVTGYAGDGSHKSARVSRISIKEIGRAHV